VDGSDQANLKFSGYCHCWPQWQRRSKHELAYRWNHL